MKPLIKYRGGKSKEIPHILNYIPPFEGKYIEPFFGGGALFFHLEPERGIINDINSKLMNFYMEVQKNYPSLRCELDKIQSIYEVNQHQFVRNKKENPNERVENRNEQLYYELRDMYNGLSKKTYSEALLYFFINKTAYSGMIRYNAKGEYNVPFGRYQHLNTELVTLDHSKLLQKAEIYNQDYFEIFEKAELEDFMFLDPPYDCIFSDYGNEEYREGFGENNHRLLAKRFRDLKCKALMVIGKTPLTEELYGDLIVGEYPKIYAVNIRNRFKASSMHILVANYSIENRLWFC